MYECEVILIGHDFNIKRKVLFELCRNNWFQKWLNGA